MSEQHNNSPNNSFPLLSRKIIYQAYNMKRLQFWRKTKCLNIPSGKLVPADTIKICKHLRVDIRTLEEHIKKYIN
jgi:hypothetical protein